MHFCLNVSYFLQKQFNKCILQATVCLSNIVSNSSEQKQNKRVKIEGVSIKVRMRSFLSSITCVYQIFGTFMKTIPIEYMLQLQNVKRDLFAHSSAYIRRDVQTCKHKILRKFLGKVFSANHFYKKTLISDLLG